MPSRPILQAWSNTGRAVGLDMLVQPQAGRGLGQHRGERSLAGLESWDSAQGQKFDAPGTAGVPRAACKSVTNCECAPAGTRCIEAPTKGAEKLLSMFVRISADEPIAIGHPHIGQSLGIYHVVVANDFV